MVSDNEVWITTDPTSPSDFQVLTGHFVISDFSVTPGQDTSMTKGGDTWFRKSDSSGFHFGADRSGPGDVAAWFNTNVNPPSQCTFNHDAGDLNFAVQGTMILWVSGSVFQDNQPVTFNGTYLAQGHSGLTNNWWFAISGAMPASENSITVMDASGEYRFTFTRGGNPNDYVYVSVD